MEAGPGFRLFFGEKAADDRYAVRSVGETGATPYTVVGDQPDARPPEGQGEPPKTIKAGYALPLAFHPAGHVLLWEDERHCFHRALYGTDNWQNSEALPVACGGSVTYTANGAALLRWQPKTAGLGVRTSLDGQETQVLTGTTFSSTPSQMPDGRGVVGTERTGAQTTLRFLPLELPLADVANAWMFLETPRDRALFAQNRGLFRALDFQQLYQLYDTEAYGCGGEDDPRFPRRPYLVTTDIFWELFAAAFQGTFQLVERERAMPAFRHLVEQATAELTATKPQARVTEAFAAARAVLEGASAGNPEAALIVAASGVAPSAAFGISLDYTDFAPRGAYTTSDDAKRYFGAMRYLARLPLDADDVATLRALSPAVADAARSWLGFYRKFIAPGRSELVWDDGRGRSVAASHPDDRPFALFPLAWGWDNETLDNTIFHAKWPTAEQVTGPAGPRLLPSGLDLAAVAGNALALTLLDKQGALARYPALAARIAAVRQRFQADNQAGPNRNAGSLTQRWITALATQWAMPPAATATVEQAWAGPLWATKRLQTGLASWATLRHATVLVSDRTEAECGEAGFEPIVMRPPRGYVEPDPASFAAIAGLFDDTIGWLNSSRPLTGVGGQGDELTAGIVRRLTESRDKVRLFQTIAEKERRGVPLSTAEDEEILHVGRAAEHNFLIFLSLSKPDFALSNPEPMTKVADVAGGGATGLLNAAVGAPLEWDQVVPFYGRREIVKGVAYSYYEFTTPAPIDDAAWRRRLAAEPRPGWVAPFLSETALSCPPRTP
jgi:hypothetical protein